MDMRGFRPLAVQFDRKGFLQRTRSNVSAGLNKHLAMKNAREGEVVHPSPDAQQIYVQLRTNSIA
jgi:hypothetical protein